MTVWRKDKGQAEGKGKKQRYIAKHMLKESEPDAKISRITGMTKKNCNCSSMGLGSSKKTRYKRR